MIEHEAYRQKISEITACLKGNFRSTLSRLNIEMKETAASLRFEQAAGIRDSICGLRQLRKKQKRIYTDLKDKDVYLFFRAYNEDRYSIFFIRDGITRNRVDFSGLGEPDTKRLDKFIKENIEGSVSIPEGSLLTACILDIGASKLFIPVFGQMSPSGIAKKLAASHKEFVSAAMSI